MSISAQPQPTGVATVAYRLGRRAALHEIARLVDDLLGSTTAVAAVVDRCRYDNGAAVTAAPRRRQHLTLIEGGAA